MFVVTLWKVGIVSENGASIITSSPLQNEMESSNTPDFTESQVSSNLPENFHVETSMVITAMYRLANDCVNY